MVVHAIDSCACDYVAEDDEHGVRPEELLRRRTPPIDPFAVLHRVAALAAELLGKASFVVEARCDPLEVAARRGEVAD